MPLFDYFSAPSDDIASKVLERVGGPDPDEMPVLPVRGIDPVVQLATLESLLTGVAYDDVASGPRAGKLVDHRDDYRIVVVTITDELQAALADADEELLARVAGPWARTDEFGSTGNAVVLAEFLGSFADLAQFATERGEHLYCWMSV